jgi:hypothetical protein
MATDGGQPVRPAEELLRQEKEFYESVTALLVRMRVTSVSEALATEAGQRLRRKWMFKYGRRPPL